MIIMESGIKGKFNDDKVKDDTAEKLFEQEV